MESGMNQKIARWSLLPGLLLLFTLACGGGPETTSFLVDPPSPVVGTGEQVVIGAQPLADLGTEMEWEVQENYGGGLLRSQGATTTYVAPEAAGTYHLILRATRLDGRKVKQTIPVQVVGSFWIEPANPRVAPGGNLDFKARLKGSSRPAVRWSVQESNGGEITEDGRYTAPGRTGTYHITAVSAADASLTTQATVAVEN